MLRADLEAGTFLASVRDLIAPPDDVPRPASALAFARAEIGTAIHQDWRREQEGTVEGFRAEVGVSLAHEVDGFETTLRGRADGVWPDGDGNLVVAEVKSVGAGASHLRQLGPADLADARLQVRLYALCLARAHPETKVKPRLVLISLVDGARRDVEVPFDAPRVLGRFETLVRRHIAAARADRRRAETRAELAADVRFPYEETRPHQDELMAVVAEGLAAGRPVIATAPTGIGKTVAALVPALRFSLEQNATLFFLTAKNTQQEMVARTFQDVAAATGRPDGSLRALTFREKRRMCPPGTLLCHPDHCDHLKTFLDRTKREAVLDDLLERAVHLEPDVIYGTGEGSVMCPYALALALSLRVELVVCDYNYVYDPDVSFSVFGEEDGVPLAVVADEAHNLFDRAREYWSPFLSRTRLTDVLGRVERGEFRAPDDTEETPLLPLLGVPSDGVLLFGEVTAHLKRVDAGIANLVEEARVAHPSAMDGCRPFRPPPEAWTELAGEAASLLVRYAHYQQAHGLVRPDDPLIEILRAIMAVESLAAREAPELIPYVATAPEAEPGFGILCVDPAPMLAERHERAAGTVVMSATLTPLDYYADVLGLQAFAPLEVSMPTPFPAEHRCVRVVPSVATTWRERKRHFGTIAQLVADVVGARAGNYVAYFPSFAFLRAVQAKLRVPEETLIVQEARMGPKARERILARLRAASQPTLLLAVMGGIFAEGIDLPGEALVGAIVVGPGLPQVGFERALMQHYFDSRDRPGFAYAMLFPGMQRVVQSAGRVHRTPDDRGVIVLLDRRFLRSPYVECLPEWWSRYGPEELVSTDPGADLRAFWRDCGSTPSSGRD